MKNNTNKLNTLTLSGLIIGPILGSGLILLPPMLYYMVGDFSLIVWTIILSLGFVFALIFRVFIAKKNTSKTISFSSLVKIPIFLSLILMSFANAWLAYLLFHIAIIYTFIAFFFFKFKIYFNKTA